MGKNKLSIDLTDENKETLEAIKNEQRTPYGSTINSLIDLFCRIPGEVKSELLRFCKTRIRDLYEEMDKAGEYEFQSLANKSQTYMNLAMFLNNGRRISIDTIKQEPTMQKIHILDGVLICPSDYIILNKDEAEYCKYASVVEVRNASFGVPHFVYFATKKINEYTDSEYKIIENMCVREWPRFKEIIDSVVEPIVDPEEHWNYLNKEELDAAPQIGHFEIYCQGDPSYPSNFKPPMGTRIIRN